MYTKDDVLKLKAELTPTQRVLLEKRLRGNVTDKFSPTVIPQRSNQSYAPMSSAQKRMWILQQLEPDNTAYNVPLAFQIQGSLEVAILKQALTEIIQRHEVLRTYFTMYEEQPVQLITPPSQVTLPIVDLHRLTKNEQKIQILALYNDEIERPFDLANDLPVRICLLSVMEREYVLFLTFHHIVFDGWTLGVFVQELYLLYNAFLKGNSSPLSKLIIQYADYAAWEQGQIQSGAMDRYLSYWKRQLAGSAELLALPTDRPRPVNQTFRGAKQSLTIPQDILNELKFLSQTERATLFMTCLAVFKVLLYRYSGQTDILVGTPIVNRNQTELESLIGLFLNTLVLRLNLSNNPTFRTLLGNVRQLVIEAQTHQALPFELLVEKLKPNRALSHSPLFQVMFIFNNSPSPKVELSGLQFRNLDYEQKTAQFDLTLSIRETPTGMVASFEYNTDLFNSTTIKRMLTHFKVLLAGIAANPDQRLLDLPILTEAESKKRIDEWNDTSIPYPEDQCIHQLFEHQVRQTPDAVAIMFGEHHFSYQYLNERADELASYLQSLGVGPEVLVGICLERSIEMVISLLGILKAGGAYLPLDPTHPPERLASILQSSQVSLLITESQFYQILTEINVKLIYLRLNDDFISRESKNSINSMVASDNLAYVIYTSGSTGKPKGVQISHRSVINFLTTMKRQLGLTKQDRVLAITTFSFDISVLELLLPITVGACIVLGQQGLTRDIMHLQEVLIDSKSTVMQTTPTSWQMLLEAGWVNKNSLKILCGGEALSSELANKLLNQTDSFWNLYGPTETTIWSASHQIIINNSLVVIGRPIDNTSLFILNDLHLVPTNVIGELYIGGVGLARGYRGQPRHTSEKFIPDPFSRKPGARLYKTGDLARYHENGMIEFVGRIDHQVKIRGYRIELGEIESILRQYPNISEAVIIAHEDSPNNKRLVAYVVSDSKRETSSRKLRAFLKKHLPDYMVPSRFIWLPTLPLTPNGKVDRQSLPAPKQTRSELETVFVAPRTPVEIILAKEWAKLLRVDRIGIHDNFFELGGDSLMILQLIAVAAQANLTLTPQQLFQHQTIAELSSVVNTAPIALAEQGVLSGSLPLTPIQHYCFEYRGADFHHYNLSQIFQVRDALDPAILEEAIRQLLNHHDALRIHFVRDASGWQQFISPLNEMLPFSYIDLSGLSKIEQSAEIQFVADNLQRSLDLAREPRLRIGLFDLGRREGSRLLIIVNHLVADPLTMQILFEDLQFIYQQLQRGGTVQLPAKTTSYKQWSNRLTEYAQSPVLPPDLAYWLDGPRTRTLRGLPVDYHSGKHTYRSERTVLVSFSIEETDILLNKIPVTFDVRGTEVLLAGVAKTLIEWTGETSALVGLLDFGRISPFEDIDLSKTVGWFTNIYPALFDLADISSFSGILHSVKTQLRSIPSRGLGYGLLRYLRGDKDIEQKLRVLQPDIFFNFLGYQQYDDSTEGSQLFRIAEESIGSSTSPRITLEQGILGYVSDNQLQFRWIYSENRYAPSTIEEQARNYTKILREFITRYQSNE